MDETLRSDAMGRGVGVYNIKDTNMKLKKKKEWKENFCRCSAIHQEQEEKIKKAASMNLCVGCGIEEDVRFVSSVHSRKNKRKKWGK